MSELDRSIRSVSYYAAKSRRPSSRQVRDVELKLDVSRVHRDNFRVYGVVGPDMDQLPQRLRNSDHVRLVEANARVTHDIGEAAPLPRQQCRVSGAVPVLRLIPRSVRVDRLVAIDLHGSGG